MELNKTMGIIKSISVYKNIFNYRKLRSLETFLMDVRLSSNLTYTEKIEDKNSEEKHPLIEFCEEEYDHDPRVKFDDRTEYSIFSKGLYIVDRTLFFVYQYSLNVLNIYEDLIKRCPNLLRAIEEKNIKDSINYRLLFSIHFMEDNYENFKNHLEYSIDDFKIINNRFLEIVGFLAFCKYCYSSYFNSDDHTSTNVDLIFKNYLYSRGYKISTFLNYTPNLLADFLNLYDNNIEELFKFLKHSDCYCLDNLYSFKIETSITTFSHNFYHISEFPDLLFILYSYFRIKNEELS